MMSKDNVIRGNTVLAPQYEPTNPEKKQQEDLRKARAINKANREKRVKSKMKIMINIGVAFIIGLVLIYRYVVMYNIRQDLSNIKSQVAAVNKENDNLKVILVSASSINEVEKTATEKLHMVRANRNQVVYADLTKDNFKNTSNKNNEDTEVGFIQKIINKLF